VSIWILEHYGKQTVSFTKNGSSPLWWWAGFLA